MEEIDIKLNILNFYGFDFNYYNCIKMNINQNILAICNENNLILIRDNNEKYCIFLDSNKISNMIFFQNSFFILCVTQDSLILVDYEKLNIESKLKLKNEKILSSCLTKDENFIIIGSSKGNVYFIQIDNKVLQMTSYAIFWNQSCKGHCTQHPGGIVYIDICPYNKILHIVFNHGVISKFGLENKEVIKIINIYEDIFSCTRLNDNVLVLGFMNSTIAYCKLDTFTLDRKKLSNDFSTTGCIWKIDSFYDNNENDICICAGGLSSYDDTGNGLSYFIKTQHIVLSLDEIKDFCCYCSENKLYILVLKNESIVKYIFKDDKISYNSEEILNNYIKIDNISSILTINYESLSSLIKSNIFEKIHNIKDNSILFLFFIGTTTGILKLFILTTKYDIICISSSILNIKSSINSLYFINDLLYIYTNNNIYIVTLDSNPLLNEMNNLIIKSNNDVEMIKYKDDNIEINHDIINIIFVITFSIISSPIIYNNIIIFLSNSTLYCIENWSNVKILNPLNEYTDLKNRKFSIRSNLKLFNPTHLVLPNKSTDIYEIKYIKSCYIQNSDYLVFIQINDGSLISFIFNNKLQFESFNLTCVISDPILVIHILNSQSNNNKSIYDSTYFENIRFIIITKNSINIYSTYKFIQLLSININSSSLFTDNYLIVSNDIFIMNSNYIISCYSLLDLSLKYTIFDNLLPANFINLIPYNNHFYIIIIKQNQIFFISLQNNLNYSISNLIPITSQSQTSTFLPVKVLYDLMQQKPIDLKDIIILKKDIVPSTISDSSSGDTLRSQLLIRAAERKEKLSKAAEDAERLKNSASKFQKTTQQILQKAKKGLL